MNQIGFASRAAYEIFVKTGLYYYIKEHSKA